MDQRINLTWLRTFEAAARHLNFTEAAKELGLTQTAVSLHVRSLEETLGSRLFVRRARHVSLSEIGQAYLPSVRHALLDIDLATTSLFGPVAQKMLTVKLPVSTATLWLAPRIMSFHRKHPDVRFRIVSSIWTETPGPRNVDVEIRLGRGDWIDLQSEKLSSECVVPICARQPAIPTELMDDIARGPLIHILGHESNWDRYFAQHSMRMQKGTQGYFVDTTTAALELVAAGAGFAMVLERFVKTASSAMAGVSVAGPSMGFAQSHYLMRRADPEPSSPIIELFEDWLREQFNAPV